VVFVIIYHHSLGAAYPCSHGSAGRTQRGRARRGDLPENAFHPDAKIYSYGHERKTGIASVAGIVSQRWEWASLHLNAAASLTRQQHPDLFLGAILEGPHEWEIRPVAEVFYDRDFAAATARSALIGAIWQVGEDVSFDIGLRSARVGDHTAEEIRLGVTFASAIAR
jgi:hypothetical protein